MHSGLRGKWCWSVVQKKRSRKPRSVVVMTQWAHKSWILLTLYPSCHLFHRDLHVLSLNHTKEWKTCILVGLSTQEEGKWMWKEESHEFKINLVIKSYFMETLRWHIDKKDFYSAMVNIHENILGKLWFDLGSWTLKERKNIACFKESNWLIQ